MHILRARGDMVLPIAWTGIAATLLKGGKTVHSQFLLPLNINETSISNIKESHKKAKLIRKCKLIIWDEAPMSSVHALNCVDKLLRLLMKNDIPFGGKCIVLGGDFRQILTVVHHGSKTMILERCIKNSPVWPYFRVLKLTINMRTGLNERLFSDWLIKLGDGSLQTHDDIGEQMIKIPNECIETESIEDAIFPSNEIDNIDLIKNKCILCPKNDDTLNLNERILERLKGVSETYLSVDSVQSDDQDEENNIPIDFLYSITPSGMPPHRLNLKVGSIVILLRNLNLNEGNFY